MELMLQLLKATSTLSSPPTGPTVLTRKSSLVTNSKSSSEKDYWTQLQLAIGDSQHFLDLINNLKWEDGLSQDSVNLVESKLQVSTNYNNDCSSNDGDSSQPPLVPTSSSLISVSMARHASESVSVLFEFAVSIVHYQYSFEPHNNAVIKVEKIKKDIEG